MRLATSNPAFEHNIGVAAPQKTSNGRASCAQPSSSAKTLIIGGSASNIDSDGDPLRASASSGKAPSAT
jgi:hypothetical protein